ncbi:MAG TPA: PAS domain S-box protein, partial [Coleofasciculaceae cyanobacterium]
DYLVKGKLSQDSLCRSVHTAIVQFRLHQQLKQQQQQQQMIAALALRIRQSLNLESILNTSVDEVRQLLRADRVIVYQFFPDMSGQIVAESVLPTWQVCLGTHIEDTYFRTHPQGDYCQGRAQVIDNIYTANLTDCYVQLLQQFQIQANLVVPILLKSQPVNGADSSLAAPASQPSSFHLWGLLSAHQCSAPRQWKNSELELMEQLAVQIAIAIRQAELYQGLQTLNTQLEEKVQTRTAELQQSNAELQEEIVRRQTTQQILEESQFCLRLINAITSTQTFGLRSQQVVEQILLSIHRFFPALRARYCTIDLQGQQQTQVSLQPDSLIDCTGMQFDVQQAPDYLSMLWAGKPLIAADIFREPQLAPIADRLSQINIRAMLDIPIKLSETTLGLLSLTSEQSRDWSLHEQQTFAEIANFMAFAAQSAVIREQKQRVQKALQVSERKFRTIFNSTFQFMGLMAPDGTLLDINETALSFGVLTPEAVMGQLIWETPWFNFSSSAQNRLREAIQTAASCQLVRYETQIRGQGDVILDVDVSLKPLLDETGNVYQILGEARDISARKQAEKVLKQTHQELTYLINHTPLATIQWDREFRVQDWSLRAEEMFGWKAEEVMGANFYQWSFVFEEDREVVNQNTAYLLDGSRSSSIVHNRNYRKDGLMIYCEWYNSALLDEAGNLVSILSLIQDVSDRKKAELELKRAKDAAETANRAKSTFLANMSHELRTPLNAILGFSELMVQDCSLTQEQQEQLGMINRSGEHLLAVINDILEMSKIEAGQVTFNPVKFDLYYLLDTLEEMLHLRAESKGLQLMFDRAPHLPRYVKTDENKLRQILINLLGNAIKFTQQGRVTLRVDSGWSGGGQRGGGQSVGGESGGQAMPHPSPMSLTLHFKIEDTGSGIDPDELESLFEPFVQSKSSKIHPEGTGLGLPISRQFARLLGGDLTVSSVPGQGSTFMFYLPVTLGPAASQHRSYPRAIALAPGQPTYRILLVEDTCSNRQLMVGLLQPLGFELKEAVNGQEAVALWESWRPHLIWMDIRMPVMDGYEAITQIRQAEQRLASALLNRESSADPQPGADILNPCKIIALTASAFEEERTHALAMGYDDFVRKPLQRVLILEKIAEHLGVCYQYQQTKEHKPPKAASPLVSAAAPHHLADSLTPASLQSLPTEWIKQFHQASTQLNARRMLALLQQLPEEHRAIAQAFQEKVNNFDFEQIMNLTQPLINQD